MYVTIIYMHMFMCVYVCINTNVATTYKRKRITEIRRNRAIKKQSPQRKKESETEESLVPS